MRTNTFLSKLNTLDLKPVANKLVSSANGWTIQQAELAINRYKKFLCLHFLFPCIELVPTKEIDEVWHAHILLDTNQYIQDCNNLYGYILHHRSPSNENEVQHQSQEKAFAITNTLFEKLFGEDILENTKYQPACCMTLPAYPRTLLEISACVSLPDIKYNEPKNTAAD